eukprot:scaffold190925_cov44-Prasinocladus_malaysianus.AAC.1
MSLSVNAASSVSLETDYSSQCISDCWESGSPKSKSFSKFCSNQCTASNSYERHYRQQLTWLKRHETGRANLLAACAVKDRPSLLYLACSKAAGNKHAARSGMMSDRNVTKQIDLKQSGMECRRCDDT